MREELRELQEGKKSICRVRGMLWPFDTSEASEASETIFETSGSTDRQPLRLRIKAGTLCVWRVVDMVPEKWVILYDVRISTYVVLKT